MNHYIRSKCKRLGLWSLTVLEAAHLIALDMFYSGRLNKTYDDLGFDPESDNDPRIISLLSGEISRIESSLINSINQGWLDTEHTQRDFDENIIAAHTYVSYDNLRKWILSRGYTPGDVLSEWEDDEHAIASYILREINSCKAAQKEGKATLNDIIRMHDRHRENIIKADGKDNIYRIRNARKNGVDTLVAIAEIENERRESVIKDYDSLYASWRLKVDAIDKLTSMIRNQQPSGQDHSQPPLRERTRRTLLTVIAALCQKGGIDWEQRGAVHRIKELTEGIGAPVSDDTVRKILKDIPDALESRMK